MKTSIAILAIIVTAGIAAGLSTYAGKYQGGVEMGGDAGGTRLAGTDGPWNDTPDAPLGMDEATSSPIQGAGQQPTTPPAGATQIRVRGKIVCLPHKNTEGPQTMECAFGLKADDGRYYALSDTDPNYQNVSGVPMDVRVQVDGTFTTRDGSNYQDIGIIYVTDINTL